MAEKELHQDLARAAAGSQIAFNFDKQAWFPVNGQIPSGAVTARLLAGAIYERRDGMRTRAIRFELEHGDGDEQPDSLKL